MKKVVPAIQDERIKSFNFHFWNLSVRRGWSIEIDFNTTHAQGIAVLILPTQSSRSRFECGFAEFRFRVLY